MKREMDQKSPNVTRGQAAEYFGLSKNALRNYETMCLVNPQVGENGYRYYHEEDISALSTIRMYRDMGYTLESIQQLMRSPSLQNLSELFDEHQKELFAMQEELIRQTRKCCAMHTRLGKAARAPLVEERRETVELLWKPRIDEPGQIGDETDKQWLTAFPDVSISGILDFEQGQLTRIECGMAIDMAKRTQYGLEIDSSTRQIVIKHCIYGILPCHMIDGNYVVEDYMPLFEYARKNGLKPGNRVYTRGLASCHLDHLPEYYLDLWLPLEED